MALSSLSWWAEDPTYADGASEPTPRAVWYAAFALLVLHATLAWIARSAGILTGQDDVRYIVLARALSQGTYRDLLWPDAPLHHMYPPGYPALLAGWRALGGEGFDWLIGLQVVLSTSSLALLYDAMRRRVAPVVALGTLALSAVNPSLLQQAGAVTSEPALMWTIALCVWASVAMTPGARRDTVVIIAATAAPLMRSAGMVVPFAIIGTYVLQRRWRAATIAAVVSVPVVGVLLWWTLTDPQPVIGSSYAADLVVAHERNAGLLANLIERLRVNFLFYSVRAVPSLLEVPTIQGTIVDNALVTGMLIVTMVAGLFGAAKRLPVMAAIVVGMIGLLFAWSWQIVRYVIPIVPLIQGTVLLGGWRIGRRASKAGAIALPALCVAVLVVPSGAMAVHEAAQGRHCDRGAGMPDPKCMTDDQWRFIQAARFVRDSIEPNALVLSAKSATLWYYSGRLTYPYQRFQNLNGREFRDSARAVGSTYLTISNLQTSERAKLVRVLIANCQYLSVTREFSRRTLLLRWSDSLLPQDKQACGALARYTTDPNLLKEVRDLQMFRPKIE